MKGFDCATPLTASTAAALANMGMKFAARYLVPASYAWKRLTEAEAEFITSAGMQIISVYETTASSASGGAAAGKKDGASAYTEAIAIGQPQGTTIYFAVDYDAQAADYAAIEAYLRAAQQQIGSYKAGVYGSYAVVEAMASRGAVTQFWQTYAWSNGKQSTKANIWQYKNNQSIAGINLDLNNTYGNEGGWTTMTYKDVPSTYWAQADIDKITNLGLMNGYGDGTFKPDQSLTRAELAVVLSRLVAMKSSNP